MSDHWEFFPCTMGDDQAFIFTDIGISERLSRESAAKLLKVRLDYKAPSDNGLPTDQEYEPALAIEDAIQAYAEKRGDLYVGRITKSGQRHFLIYVNDWAGYPEEIAAIGQSHEYDLRCAEIEDPGHSQYWEYLWPTDADWRVINDMKVIRALEEAGDDHDKSRDVDHWVYFEDLKSALLFKDWAIEFGLVEAEPVRAVEKGHLVRLKHRGTMRLGDITGITTPLALKASKMGGDYDGWETQVVLSSEQQTEGEKSAL